MRALILVDVQNDFCPQGALATRSGAVVAKKIAAYIEKHHSNYSTIIATKDWHIDPAQHWSENPDYINTWPVHCEANTPGADFHPAIGAIHEKYIDAIFRKGRYSAAYSGFEGTTDQGVSLETWLKNHAITQVDVVGIATDYCVRATCLDALQRNFTVQLLTDYIAPVSLDTGKAALEEMKAAGVILHKD